MGILNPHRFGKRLAKEFLLVSSLAATTLFAGCERQTPAAGAAKPEAAAEVRLVRPSRGEITRSITLPGELKAYQSATLYAKVPGYLKSIAVDKGDAVKEGAVLAEIEAPELLADRTRYRAEVELAEIDYKRLNEAQKKAPDLVVPLSVDTAKGRVDMARAVLERAEVLLQFTKITAPFSGVVTRRMVDPGAFIPAATSSSNPQNAALLTLMDFRIVRLQVAVPEAESALVAKDQPITLRVEGLPDREFAGKITRFSYALDDATKTMLAEAELPNPTLELRPGMYATVKIGIEQKKDALLLPAAALTREKANTFVFTLAENKAHKVPVKIGFADTNQVEILSGIKGDEDLIVSANRTLAEGQPVHATEGK